LEVEKATSEAHEAPTGWLLYPKNGLRFFAREGGKDGLLRMALDDFEHWHTLHRAPGEELSEGWRLKYSEADVQPTATRVRLSRKGTHELQPR
jgi:hypothetical protein